MLNKHNLWPFLHPFPQLPMICLYNLSLQIFRLRFKKSTGLSSCVFIQINVYIISVCLYIHIYVYICVRMCACAYICVVLVPHTSPVEEFSKSFQKTRTLVGWKVVAMVNGSDWMVIGATKLSVNNNNRQSFWRLV